MGMSEKLRDAGYLTGQMLIAMPQMQDPFSRSVVYICAHTAEGAMGLVVNRLFNALSFPDLLEQLNIKPTPVCDQIRVHFGGPVEAGRGFVLHSTDYVQETTLLVDELVGLTATVDVLKAIADGRGPRHSLLALGYAGWAAGQLDGEIRENAWSERNGRRRSLVRQLARKQVGARHRQDRRRLLDAVVERGTRLNDVAARPTRLLDHLLRCNNRDLSRFRPFLAGSQRIGWVRDDFVEHLKPFGDTFEYAEDSVSIASRLATLEARTAAMSQVVRKLVQRRVFAKFRNENYAVVTEWGAPPLLLLDRSAVAPFGVRAFGVHVNGYTRRGGKMLLWIGRRALDKAVEPGKLDNMVAGGQPAGLSLTENLVKEAGEEAGIPRALALRAVHAGAISYCMEGERGVKPDTMFVYDLDVPEDFMPENTDGEIDDFRLMELDEVVERVRTSYDFKFNVSLVLIDFLIRVGHITPDNEPDYLALISSLHAPL